MYLEMDLYTPRLGEYVLNEKAKNRVLAHFPRATVNGEAVFGNFYLYLRSNGVQETANHKKLYQILGIDADELRKQTWDGVDSLWLYFNEQKNRLPLDITHQDFYSFAYANCASGVQYSVKLQFESAWNITVDGIESMLLGTDRETAITHTFASSNGIGINSNHGTANSFTIVGANSDTVNPAAFIALHDFDRTLFDINIEVGTSTKFNKPSNMIWNREAFSGNRNPTTNFKTAVNVTFTIKDNIPILNCATLFDRILANPKYISTFFYQSVDATNPSTIWVRDRGRSYLRVAAVEAMKAREFGFLMRNTIDSDYEEEDKDWWEVLLAIVILVVVAWFAPPLAAAMGMTAAASVAMVFITVSSLVLMATSYLMQLAGNFGGAIFFGRVMVILSKVGAVLAIINIFQTAINALAVGMKSAMNSLFSSFKNLLGGLKEVFNVFSSIENLHADDTSKQNESQDAEQDLEAMNSPVSMELIQKCFDDYTYLDINEQMDSMCYDMTQGKVDKSTTKYFS